MKRPYTKNKAHKIIHTGTNTLIISAMLVDVWSNRHFKVNLTVLDELFNNMECESITVRYTDTKKPDVYTWDKYVHWNIVHDVIVEANLNR